MPEVLKPAACGSLIKKPRYPTFLKFNPFLTNTNYIQKMIKIIHSFSQGGHGYRQVQERKVECKR